MTKPYRMATPAGDRMVKSHFNKKDGDPMDFYKAHRGGTGNVVMVFASYRGDERFAIFGSIETAKAWALKLGDDFACAFVPYVIDEPDFGNTVRQ